MFIGPGTEEKEQSQKEDLHFQNSRFQLEMLSHLLQNKTLPEKASQRVL